MNPLFFLAAALAIALPAAAVSAPLPEDVACRLGAYAAPDGGAVILTPLDKSSLRYLMPDGERGTLRQTDGGDFVETAPRPAIRLSFPRCDSAPRLTRDSGTSLTLRRVKFRETLVQFDSDGLRLSGKLVTAGTGNPQHVAIYVDGSDQTPAVDSTYWQYALPLRGVGVFVLDKRGTGGSAGAQTANFHLRAADVVAAVREVRRQIGARTKVGLLGLSQGGWVAPLAATLEPVDFVVVGYGLAEGVTSEDRDELIQDLQAAGFGPKDLAEALELQSAAADVARSHWTRGWERLDALKIKYAKAPWLKAIGNEGFTGLLVQMPSKLAREIAPKVDLGVSFEYEPRPVIAGLQPRQLWILGGDDRSAPSARTLQILTEVQAQNATLAVAVFPKADHGIVEEFQSDGVSHVRLAAGYLDLVAGWMRDGRVRQVDGVNVQPARSRGTHTH